MAKQGHQVVLTSISTTGLIARIIAGVTGNLVITYLKNATPNGSGPAKFDIRVEGVSIYDDDPSLYLTLNTSATEANATFGAGDIGVIKGQIIEVYAMTLPSGGLAGLIAVQVDIEDGQAVQGPTGAGFTPRGAWNSGTAYTARDVVTYSGETYNAVASSTNVVPGTDGTKWEKWAAKGADGTSGGSSGGVMSVDSPPASPTAQDDEFNSSTLNSKWTQATTGTAPTISIDSLVRGNYLAKFGAADGAVDISQDFVPGSSDFSVTACVYTDGRTNYQGVALYAIDSANNPVGNGTGSNAIRLAIFYNGSVTVFMHDYLNYTLVGSSDTPIAVGRYYLHIQRVGGTWLGAWSYNGVTWHVLGTTSLSFVMAKIRLSFFQSTATTKQQGACDWVRRNWLFI